MLSTVVKIPWWAAAIFVSFTVFCWNSIVITFINLSVWAFVLESMWRSRWMYDLFTQRKSPPSLPEGSVPQRSIYYLPHLLHLYYAFMANQKDTDSLNMLDRLWDIIMCSTCVIKYIPDTKRDSNECASCLLQSECVTVNHQKWGIAPHCCTSLFCISLFSHVEHVTSKFSISTLKTFKLYSF